MRFAIPSQIRRLVCVHFNESNSFFDIYTAYLAEIIDRMFPACYKIFRRLNIHLVVLFNGVFMNSVWR